MKIFCVGRNYVEHARELNNPVPEEPILFIKPSTALLREGKAFYFPDFTREIHHELELVVKITKNGRHVAPEFASSYYDEMTLGLDFTARDIQSRLKAKGHPWEIAKAFDYSAPVGDWIPFPADAKTKALSFRLIKNGDVVQQGSTDQMIFPIDSLIVHVSRYFKLQSGDLLFTGTPAGVGPIAIGDVLEGYLGDRKLLHCEIK